MRNNLGFVLIGLVLLLVLGTATLYTVDERENAIVLQLGEIKDVVTEPGLHLKMPLIQNVRYFSKQILTLDTPDAELFTTSEKKNVLVDSFVKWRISDSRQFAISVGDEAQALQRLTQNVNSALREEFGKRTLPEVISGQRDQIMKEVVDKVQDESERIGVQIVDVRLKRVEYPEGVTSAVYRQMEAERRAVAAELRSQGYSEAEKIRAEADREREVIVANAYSKAQAMMGEGDARATAIYAQAFGQNPEFYAFYRSLEAYRASFRNRSDVIVVSPESAFFRYLKNSRGGGGQ